MPREIASTADVYRYVFHASVPMGQVSNALFLAASAAEAIHGRAQVQLDGDFRTDPIRRGAVIDATSQVGQTIARVFTQLITQGLGQEAFQIERVPGVGSTGAEGERDPLCDRP